MTIEEILSGESKNIEFKAQLPEKSVKYMKSVVAFANGIGGKIIFGVEDNTREIVGIDKDTVFTTMDAIANAISDSCEPAIIPDISLQTILGKTIIVVEVSPGTQRPYFLKSQGRDHGVYVRVAGTTRPADDYMIKELLFEGSNRCFDQNILLNKKVSEEDIADLCKSLKDTAIRNAKSETAKADIKDVTARQLLSWGVLAQNGEYLPTNSYAILVGDWPTTIQCGVFKGTTKSVFVDRREFRGPLQEQIEQAYQFVLRNIHLGATFQGLYRQDDYEIPTDAIRELIINAAVHRSYLDHSNIQIAIYDDRLEVTSPGKLPMGQTVERMKAGYSKIRNEALASAFAYMNLIEHWGSGIPRIIDKVREADLREPEFIGGETDLRINIYRRQAHLQPSDSLSHGVNGSHHADKLPETDIDCRQTADKLPITEQEKQIHKYTIEQGSITTAQAAALLGIKDRRARDILGKMVDKKWLKKEGAYRSTIYIINTDRR